MLYTHCDYAFSHCNITCTTVKHTVITASLR